jgi:6-phosphofructokinase 1
MTKYVGILTAGGDSPGLNAAIRAVGRAAKDVHGMQVIGFRDGFRGLMQNRTMRLEGQALSGILTVGGTILGTSRDKPHRMEVGGQELDMTDVMVDTYNSHHLDALVCLGGGGTQRSAHRLAKKGLNIVTLPKTIDNDVWGTDVCFGFDTALGIATAALDRLHSTAHSHHRIIVVEIMGHNAGWLALGAGIAGGADVIVIPEIHYDVENIAEAILRRNRGGKHFSIVAVSEGARPVDGGGSATTEDELPAGQDGSISAELRRLAGGSTLHLARQLEERTGLESRVTILGHLQRGGAPSAADRLLATRLGTACAGLIDAGVYGIMVAARGDEAVPVPLDEVAGRRRTVPPDHPWIDSARAVGTSLGDRM